MRRMLALLLVCLLLLPSAGLAENTSAAPFTAGEDLLARFDARPYRVESLTAWGDTLLFTDSARLYMLQGGQATTGRLDTLLGHSLEWRNVVPLVSGEGLWLLDKNAGMLWALTAADGAFTVGEPQSLYWEDYRNPMGDYVEVFAPEHYAVIKGRLCALEASGQVMVWDSDTGSKQKSPLEGVQWMAPYQDGHLLTLCWQEDTEEGKPHAMMIRIADPLTGEIRDVRPLQPDDQRTLTLRTAAYDPTSDTLYTLLGDMVYRFAGLGEGEQAAIPPHDDYGMGLQMAALPNSLLLFAGYRDLYLRQADPQTLKNRATLNILVSDTNSQGINQAAGSLPGIDVLVTEQGIDQETLAQLMITSDDTYDLYWVLLSRLDFDSVMRKGYAVDLSSNPMLLANHQQLSLAVKAAVGGEAGVFALPVGAYATVYLQEAAFAGPQGKAPIKTLSDLVAFFERWPEEFAAQHPNMMPMDTEQLRRHAYAMVLRAYIDGYIGAGIPLTFDTALLRQLFTRMEALPWAGLGEVRDGDYFAPVLFDNEWMLSLPLMDGDGRDNYTYLPFLPTPEPGMEGALPLSVSVVFVNPFSAKKTEAMAFVEAMIRQVSPDARLMLYHQDSPPVENPFYRQTIEDRQARVDQLRYEASLASGDKKQELEESANRVAFYLEELKETARWLISAEQMAAWRALSQNAFVVTRNGERQGADAAMEVLTQYADGVINLEQYIREVESRLRLIRQEGL